MKTKELIERVKELEFIGGATECNGIIFIRNILHESIMVIDKKYLFSLSSRGSNYEKLLDEEKEQLMSIVIPYISTPPEERKEEKRYYVRSRFMNNGNSYLNLSNTGGTVIASNWETKTIQTKFTIKELKKLGIAFNENDEPIEWILEEVE